jgi:hypothetical protein
MDALVQSAPRVRSSSDIRLEKDVDYSDHASAVETLFAAAEYITHISGRRGSSTPGSVGFGWASYHSHTPETLSATKLLSYSSLPASSKMA